MKEFKITLLPLNSFFYIYKLSDLKQIPEEILSSDFFSVTKTDDEISVLTNCSKDFGFISSGQKWKGFRVEGVLDFGMVGIINEITQPLRDHNISVFVVSTFDTDYIFVGEKDFDKAADIFRDNLIYS